MALAPREFAIDFNRKTVYANPSIERDYTFAPFTNGDTESFKIYIVSANPSAGQGALTPLTSLSGLSFKVAIGPRNAGTPTTYTSVTLTASGSTFIGDLPLNVAAINSLFSSNAADQNPYIEFELNDGGPLHTVRRQITLQHQIIDNTLVDATAPDTALGKLEGAALYVKRANTDATQPWQQIVNDSDGSGRLYVLRVVDGVLKLDTVGS